MAAPPMLRACFPLCLLLVACGADLFVLLPLDDDTRTHVFLVRKERQPWQVLVREPGDPTTLTEAPSEVHLVRYRSERVEVEAWLASRGVESCALLGGQATRLRLEEPAGFDEIELSDELKGALLPEWTELCVTCQLLLVSSSLYPFAPGDPEQLRNGGPNAPLPSGAFLAAGRPADGFFRVTETEVRPMESDFSGLLVGLERLEDGRYLAAVSNQLRFLEVDVEEISLRTLETHALDDTSEMNAIVKTAVSAPGEPFEVLVLDAKARLLRFDGTVWEVLAQAEVPPLGFVSVASIVRLDASHAFFHFEESLLFEWRDGRLFRRDVNRGDLHGLMHSPDLGLLVGGEKGEVSVFESEALRSLGAAGLSDDVNNLAPYRDGFLVFLKGGFIGQYASHLGQFCPGLTGIPGAQNAGLRSVRPSGRGFACSDCLQSRSGGVYGFVWVDPE